MPRRKRQPIPNQEALEEQMLTDLFRRRRASGREMQRLVDYTSEHELRVLAHLAQREDVAFVGDGQVIITFQGVRRIMDKHPELES